MPDKKKPITELSTPDLIKHLFPKKVITMAKRVAHEKDAKRSSKKK